MKKSRGIVLGMAFVSLMPVAASALSGNLNIGYSSSDAPVVTIYGPGVSGLGVYAVPFEVTGGSWLPSPTSAPSGFNQNDFFTFCTDIGAEMQTHATYAADTFGEAGSPPNPGVNPPWRQGGGSYLTAIQQAQYLFLHNYTAAFGHNGSMSTIIDHNMAGGLQLAIWNVLYDADYSISGGSFHATGNLTALADAQVLLNQLAAQPQSAWDQLSSTWLDPRSNPTPTQGLLYPPSVPDGGTTAMMLGMAVSGLGLLNRRLRK